MPFAEKSSFSYHRAELNSKVLKRERLVNIAYGLLNNFGTAWPWDMALHSLRKVVAEGMDGQFKFQYVWPEKDGYYYTYDDTPATGAVKIEVNSKIKNATDEYQSFIKSLHPDPLTGMRQLIQSVTEEAIPSTFGIQNKYATVVYPYKELGEGAPVSRFRIDDIEGYGSEQKVKIVINPGKNERKITLYPHADFPTLLTRTLEDISAASNGKIPRKMRISIGGRDVRIYGATKDRIAQLLKNENGDYQELFANNTLHLHSENNDDTDADGYYVIDLRKNGISQEDKKDYLSPGVVLHGRTSGGKVGFYRYVIGKARAHVYMQDAITKVEEAKALADAAPAPSLLRRAVGVIVKPIVVPHKVNVSAGPRDISFRFIGSNLAWNDILRVLHNYNDEQGIATVVQMLNGKDRRKKVFVERYSSIFRRGNN